MRYQEGRPEVAEIFTAQSQKLKLVLDTRLAVHKSHLELALQAVASHKKKSFKWGIDRIGFVL